MRSFTCALALSLIAFTAQAAPEGPIMSVNDWSAIYLCGFLDGTMGVKTSCSVDHGGHTVNAVAKLTGSPAEFCEALRKSTRDNSAYFGGDWKLLVRPRLYAESGIVTCLLKNT